MVKQTQFFSWSSFGPCTDQLWRRYASAHLSTYDLPPLPGTAIMAFLFQHQAVLNGS
jgi:hypothetical protein